MKAFTSSSFLVGIHADYTSFHSSSSSSREFNLAKRREFGLFQSKKLVGLFHLICFERKPLLPVLAASSSSSLSQQSLTTSLEEAVTETQNPEICESKTVHVKIQLNKECSFGEQFVVVGDDPILGMWDPESAIPLNWSDGHVWVLELDVPIGKAIQFKFLLKELTGKISWQPGPDRVLKTWETSNTIVVCEDWEDATSQKLLEEKPNSDQNKVPTSVNSDALIVADNLSMDSDAQIATENSTAINEESISDVSNEAAVVANVGSSPPKEPLPSTPEKSIVANNVEPLVDTSTEDVVAKNGRVLTVGNSATASVDIEESVFTHDGEPVLVPGLPPLSVDSSEQEARDKEEGSGFAASAEVGVENQNTPELDQKQEVDEDHQEVERIKVYSNELILQQQLERKTSANEEKKNEPEPIDNSVVLNDLQWGRRTIQKLLTNFGFL